MASPICHRKDDDRRQCYTSDTPHFFKIVLAHTLREGKLNIPKKFVRKYGKSLQNNLICLKLPSGAEWNVGLTKSDGQIWFQNGWQEFVEFYCIKLGFFLTFRYEGNSCFHVIIFDHSASEIQYAVKKTHVDENNKEVVFDDQGQFHVSQSSEMKEECDDDCSVQILDNVTWSKRTRDKTQNTPCSLPNKKMKTDHICRRKTVCSSRKIVEPSWPDGFCSKELKTEIIQENEDLDCSKRESKDKCSTSKTTESKFYSVKIESKEVEVGDGSSDLKTVKSEHGSRKQASTATRARVIQKATTFKSQTTNPSFMVTMQPSYISTGRKLGIPTSFSEMHLKESTEIVLQVSSGRAWNVQWKVRWRYNNTRAELGGGWKRFVRDNNLKRGDICVFEMIKSAKISLKVTIFRAFEDE